MLDLQVDWYKGSFLDENTYSLIWCKLRSTTMLKGATTLSYTDSSIIISNLFMSDDTAVELATVAIQIPWSQDTKSSGITMGVGVWSVEVSRI